MSEQTTKLLWVGDDPAPENVRLAASGWDLHCCAPDESIEPKLRERPLVLVHPDGYAHDPSRMTDLVGALEHACAFTIFLLPDDAAFAREMLSRRGGRFLCVPEDISPEELTSKLRAVETLYPVIHSLQRELTAAREIGISMNGALEELDEQMRLAARLQRDFLPRRLPEVDPIRFAVFYRPVSWVSGDIYDVTRLDETHVGFYVADAIGHGMPAALLTMFIKKALQTKRIFENTYQIIPPDEALKELNTDICDQQLSSCQFCTGVYAIVDTSDLTLTYSRAGHPHPILIRADGGVEVLECPGSLLGVFPGEQYESRRIVLGRGDRLLLYTDGVEQVLAGTEGDRALENLGRHWSTMTSRELLLDLAERIDAPGADVPDDVTLLIMDVQSR